MELTWEGKNITVTSKVQREGSEELDRFLSQWVASECGQGDQGVTFCGTHRSGLLALFLHERERGEEGREVQVVHAPQVVEGRRVSITPPFLRRDRDAAQALDDIRATVSTAGDLATLSVRSPEFSDLTESLRRRDADMLMSLRRTQSQDDLAGSVPTGDEDSVAARVRRRREARLLEGIQGGEEDKLKKPQ